MTARKDGSGGRAIGRGYTRIGLMACLVCAREIPVKKTEGGKLSACCTWCDLPLYVNPRTEAFELVMKRVKLDQVATGEPGGQQGASSASSSSSSSSASSPPAATTTAPPTEEKKAPPRRTFAGPLFGGGFG